MKKATILTKAQITLAIEMYVEHGYNTEHIGKEIGCRTSTVNRYLAANGVEVDELDEGKERYRVAMVAALKGVDIDCAERNYKHINAIWMEMKPNA